MANKKRSMRYVGDMEEDDGSTSVMQRDSHNRLWLTNQKTGETRMHPDSVEIEKQKKADPRGAIRGQRGYSSEYPGYSRGGKVRGCGAATKGHGKGTMR